ncbi:beta-1,3-N-acetylglucosaminyltransferase radical fringe isoform X1 [Lagopus muta]|uniref:beta-1,3-N-acetylglucosaminyltransferase radical fringe isoform X1 n=1 Tax=Lagopus muta TaxID=64668 RepID=UPI0020A1250C|nr:beta-1,3-N-acetylglucosaminyltransferase radical fringe isoform X1 [Lagopus muta]
MSGSCLGLRRACFLLSVTAAAVLLLLLPRGQPPAAPRRRPPPAGPSGAVPKREARPAGSGAPGERSGGSGAAGGGRGVGGSPWPARRVRLGPPGGSGRESLELKDIFIAVKTTRKYHKTRLELLFQTWISRARGQTFIFTDWEDRELRLKAGDHMINTNCSAVHTRQALCCKMSVEYDKFLESGQKWFCHVDDDNYVNPRTLLRLLSAFSPSQDVYVGRPSLDHPIEAADHVQSDGSKTSVKFWFATGGAGFCISRGLALKMSPWASLGNFISTAERVRLPDDCTIGYIIEGLLEVKLLHSPLFHSHLENLQRLQGDSVLQQVTLSYGDPENKHNVVSVGGVFGLQQDPTRHIYKRRSTLYRSKTDWVIMARRHLFSCSLGHSREENLLCLVLWSSGSSYDGCSHSCTSHFMLSSDVT